METATCRVVFTSADGNVFPAARQGMEAACRYEPRATMTIETNGYGVHVCRNQAVVNTLKNPAWTHLLFVDHDVLLPEDAITLLLDLDVDVVTGCYPTIQRDVLPHRPVVLVGYDETQWYSTWFEGVRETLACGAGCLLIRRQVLEKMTPPWFEFVEDFSDGYKLAGEDVAFCHRLRQAGYKIMAHGGVRCGHLRTTDVASQVREEHEGPIEFTWCGPQSVSSRPDASRTGVEHGTKRNGRPLSVV